MDSQASQYASDGPTSSASSRHHTSSNHPFQYNSHNHNLPLTFSSSPSAGYSSSPTTSAFSGVVHQQQQPGHSGQWGHNTTHRSGATARDEVLPPPHLPHQPQQSTKSLKRDSTGVIMSQPNNTKMESSTNGHGHHASDDPMPSTSDFVKKLYKCVFNFFFPFVYGRLMGICRMLEDPTFQEVVSWGPAGDCFVVKVCIHCVYACVC